MKKNKKYQSQIINILKKFPALKKAKIFFGSFLHKKKFYDIDLGFLGKVDQKTITLLREKFEESNFPYKVDIVDFNKVGR